MGLCFLVRNLLMQFLDPVDPLFRKIQLAFLKRQELEYGTDHLYKCDLFALRHICKAFVDALCRYNEMAPHSLNVGYLANSTAAVYGAMREADPQAIWVLQGWMFENDPYWNASTVC